MSIFLTDLDNINSLSKEQLCQLVAKLQAETNAYLLVLTDLGYDIGFITNKVIDKIKVLEGITDKVNKLKQELEVADNCQNKKK